MFFTSNDALFFFYALAAGLGFYDVAKMNVSRLAGFCLVALLCAPLGLLTLVKGSFSLLAFGVFGLASVYFSLSHRPIYILSLLLSFAVSLVSFWLVAGQSLYGLGGYFQSMFPIIAGYGEAMALSGRGLEVVFYLVGALGLLAWAVLDSRNPVWDRAYISSLLAAYLFIAFKGGFVRHDLHAVVASNSLLIASLVVVMRSSAGWNRLSFIVVPVLGVSAFLLGLTVFNYRFTPAKVKATLQAFGVDSSEWHVEGVDDAQWRELSQTERTFLAFRAMDFGSYAEPMFALMTPSCHDAYVCFRDGLLRPDVVSRRYHDALGAIRRQFGLSTLSGTSDIYSYRQAAIIASENKWRPRPIFQSFSAYTPKLAEANRRHLLGEQAPDNIIFRIEPIDNHYPSLDDGPSWPVLLGKYLPSHYVEPYLYLTANRKAPPFRAPRLMVASQALLDEPVAVPACCERVFVQLKLSRTPAGKFIGALFKPAQLRLVVVFENGKRRTYRINSGMAEAGFLLSPYVENALQFADLYDPAHSGELERVDSFVISAGSGWAQWGRRYEVRFSSF